METSPKDGRRWDLKYRFDCKEKRLALGVHPDLVPLALAQALVELVAPNVGTAPHHRISETPGVAEGQRCSGLQKSKVAILPLHARKAGGSGKEGEAA